MQCLNYLLQLEQLQSFIKWTPSQVDTSTSSPVQQFCITSPTQAKEINTPSSQHTPVSQSEGFCSQHTPYAPKSPMVVAGATEVEQQKEIDALRTELERNRVEVHQLRMRWIPMCTVATVYLSLCILFILHLCARVYAFMHIVFPCAVLLGWRMRRSN